jgi:hypothetical protein
MILIATDQANKPASRKIEVSSNSSARTANPQTDVSARLLFRRRCPADSTDRNTAPVPPCAIVSAADARLPMVRKSSPAVVLVTASRPATTLGPRRSR